MPQYRKAHQVPVRSGAVLRADLPGAVKLPRLARRDDPAERRGDSGGLPAQGRASDVGAADSGRGASGVHGACGCFDADCDNGCGVHFHSDRNQLFCVEGRGEEPERGKEGARRRGRSGGKRRRMTFKRW